MNEMMIDVTGLRKCYGNFEAVKGIDLQIPRGELFCFLGPNGAGKTTTIKILCGLLHPDAGSIRIGGYDLRAEAHAVRTITGYIPDMPYLYDLLTVTEFIEFTGDLYGIPREELAPDMEDAIAFFGLEEHRQNLIKDLSHGMRQRLVYASTLIQRPQIMFVDEPFVGLDPRSIRSIKQLLRQKVEGGMTIFLTTHILALAEELADRIGIIDDGTILASGTLADIREAFSLQGSLEDIFLGLTEVDA
jgi:ABC-2 type transport system ATP-binding protein